MVDCCGFWARHRMQRNHVSPSALLSLELTPLTEETGSIALTEVQEGESSRNDANPAQGLPPGQNGRPHSKRSLRASIWLKLTLFIGTLVGYYFSSTYCVSALWIAFIRNSKISCSARVRWMEIAFFCSIEGKRQWFGWITWMLEENWEIFMSFFLVAGGCILFRVGFSGKERSLGLGLSMSLMIMGPLLQYS